MLCLLFRLGEDRYALETSAVEEVLPVVNWKEIPQVARGVLGVFDYHGTIVPLLDLSEFIVGRPSSMHMSTRIVLIHYLDTTGTGENSGGADGHLLGLMMEGATFTFHAKAEQFAPPGVEVKEAPYLGPVMADEKGIIQLIEVQRLLPTTVKEQLFLQAMEYEPEVE